MKKISINVGGRDYPCRLSMGAMLLFKRTTGKEVSQMDGSDVGDLLTFMWCCVACACKADEVEFDIDFERFTCMVTPDDVNEWNAAISVENEKKKK